MFLRNINVHTSVSHDDIKIRSARITVGLTSHHSGHSTGVERTSSGCSECSQVHRCHTEPVRAAS